MDPELTSWAESTRNNGAPDLSSGGTVRVCFFIRAAASPVYVHVSEESGHTVAISLMESRGDGLWERQLELMPGRYRYRFYIHDGKITVCCPPEGAPNGQFDATLHVVRKTQDAPGDARACVATG